MNGYGHYCTNIGACLILKNVDALQYFAPCSEGLFLTLNHKESTTFLNTLSVESYLENLANYVCAV